MKRKHLVGLFLALGIIACGAFAFYLAYEYTKPDESQTQQDTTKEKDATEYDTKDDSQNLSSSGNASSELASSKEDPDALSMEPANRHQSKESIYAASIAKVPAIFILKVKEGQVIVYNADGVTMYETTGIMVDSLPNSVLRELIFGKPITTFDELYDFLENYSS